MDAVEEKDNSGSDSSGEEEIAEDEDVQVPEALE